LFNHSDALATASIEAHAAELLSEPHSVPTAAASSSALWAPSFEVCGNYVVLGFAGGM
jgi:hypothetical protein